MSVALAVMGIAHLLWVLHVLLSLPTAKVVMTTLVGLSISGTLERGALVQEGMCLVFLAGVLQVCTWRCSLVYAAPASHVLVLTLNDDVVVTGVTPHQPWSFIVVRYAW
jgi:hypothetical protein